MPRLPFLGTRSVEGDLGSWNRRSSQVLHTRAGEESLTNSTARTLIIVGVACGTVAAIILIGILVYLIIRQRRQETLSSSSRIRNGYTQTRTSSADTEDSTRKNGPDRIHTGYRYDPESAHGLPSRTKKKEKRSTADRERLRLDTSTSLLSAPKQSTLMQSATSPPPFQQYYPGQRDSLLGQPIRPHAELRVGDTPVENHPSKPKPAPYIPPAPPSWASIWPTESGWTGPGGVPSIRDENFGDDSDESLSSEEDKVSKPLTDDDRESQYALDSRPTEHTFGPFKLSASLFGTTKHKHPETDSLFDPPTATLPSSSPDPLSHSPHLDDEDDDKEAVELTRLMDDTDRLERSTTGNYTLAFGNPSSIARSGTDRTSNSGKHARSGSNHANGHSRTPSSVPVTRSNTRVTRSSTTRTARTDATEQTLGSPVSTVSGQILSVLTGRLTTPLLKSVESLRRIGGSSEEREPLALDEERDQTTSPPQQSTLIRRLPTLPNPNSPIIPPVPPIPRHHLTAPGDIRRLPIPTSHSPSPPPLPNTRVIPRTVSLGPGQVPPLRVSDISSSALARSASETGATAIRPLPVPPVVIP